eukprot:jgi/Psemu1/54412/gm1.54412_g
MTVEELNRETIRQGPRTTIDNSLIRLHRTDPNRRLCQKTIALETPSSDPSSTPPECMPARRTRSHTSLGADSARDFTPTARRTLFSQQETPNMTIPPAPPPINRREDPFPSFDKPMATILPELFAYKQLPRYMHQELHLLVTFSAQLKDQGKDSKDHTLYTKEAFESYSNSVLASVADSTVKALSSQDSRGYASAKSSKQLRYESWARKSRDETTFLILNNDARFEHWLVKFKAKLKSTDVNTSTFLDSDWSPQSPSGYEADLYHKQCTFFWTLLLHVFQSDLSSSCVLSHTSNSNGRQAYFDFVKLHNQSKSKVYDTSVAMQDILSMALLSWKDTKVKFITTWFGKLEHFNKLRPPERPLSYDSICTHLCKAYPLEATDLQDFRRNQARATSELKTTLLLEAIRLDSQAALSQPSSRPSIKAHAHDFVSIKAHAHDFASAHHPTSDDTSYYPLPLDFHGDFQDYAVYRPGRAPDPSTRLPAPVWQNINLPNNNSVLLS